MSCCRRWWTGTGGKRGKEGSFRSCAMPRAGRPPRPVRARLAALRGAEPSSRRRCPSLLVNKNEGPAWYAHVARRPSSEPARTTFSSDGPLCRRCPRTELLREQVASRSGFENLPCCAHQGRSVTLSNVLGTAFRRCCGPSREASQRDRAGRTSNPPPTSALQHPLTTLHAIHTASSMLSSLHNTPGPSWPTSRRETRRPVKPSSVNATFSCHNTERVCRRTCSWASSRRTSRSRFSDNSP